jgi:peroxiredoxin
MIIATAVSYGAISSFELPQMNHKSVGTIYKSVEHQNAVLVIEAYFNGCPYCNENAPNVDHLASSYSDNKRVQVLDVGVDRSDSEYEAWIEAHHPNHPVLKDAKRVLIKQLGTTGYPSTYVLNCRGDVVYEASGLWEDGVELEIQKAIDQSLDLSCHI